MESTATTDIEEQFQRRSLQLEPMTRMVGFAVSNCIPFICCLHISDDTLYVLDNFSIWTGSNK